MCDTDWQLTKQLRGWRPPWEGCWLEREPRGGWAWSAFLYEFSSRLKEEACTSLVSAPFTTTLLTTMASRDLTSAFLDRRSATNRRRRAGGSSIGGGSKVVPFGKLLETHT